MAEWGGVALRLLKVLGVSHNYKLKDLERRSTTLSKINENFYKFMYRSGSRLALACFFEEHPTYIGGKDMGFIVGKSSASPQGLEPIPAAANHKGLCKFQDEYRKGYKDICAILTQMIEKLDEQATTIESRVSLSRLGATMMHG